jgi:deoxyribonuclease IV
VRTPDGLAEVLDECVAAVGLERLQCLHVNDSKVPLGGNADRHASLTEGEFGKKGLEVFLSEPRFDDMPVCLETPGPSGTIGIDEVKLARKLRAAGLKARSAGARRAGRKTRG